jgi:polyphenol oxidase
MDPERTRLWITPDWPAPAGVRALSTLRRGGVSRQPYESLNLGGHVGDVPSAVAENRGRLRRAARLPAEPTWLSQVHGARVLDLDALNGAEHPPEADASLTRRPGRVCAILTADCLPVLLAADSGTAVAAAHAGWRGLAGGVIEATVRALGLAPESLVAWLGPAIGPRHFEVGGEVRELMVAQDPEASAWFAPNTRGRFLADLPALVRRRLSRLGVQRIHGGGECTFSSADRYFSYRRDGTTGRQASLIWLENTPQPGARPLNCPAEDPS